MADVVAEKKVVSIHYVLRDPSGKELDRSAPDKPMEYLHGAGNIVPGLEKQLGGRAVGATATAVVAPRAGAGGRGPQPPPGPRSTCPKDARLEKGAQFVVRAPDGRAVPVWVSKVQGPTVYVDPNHPLAGVTLHFEVDVLSVRDANDEEVAHGHPHGPDGHGH
jgi:FKBP-type peptidyl-prolyl cis-trans isomerase SlyD